MSCPVMILTNSRRFVGPKIACRARRFQSSGVRFSSNLITSMRVPVNSLNACIPSCKRYLRVSAQGSVSSPGRNGFRWLITFCNRGRLTSKSTSLRWHKTSPGLHSPGTGRVDKSGICHLHRVDNAAGVDLRTASKAFNAMKLIGRGTIDDVSIQGIKSIKFPCAGISSWLFQSEAPSFVIQKTGRLNWLAALISESESFPTMTMGIFGQPIWARNSAKYAGLGLAKWNVSEEGIK